ncbi:MAG: HAD-IIA family hydrolase [Lachnospiraceae bacterium]|nr:HAD-IIA family hydrolase [Lachnospiraceae bacterium]
MKQLTDQIRNKKLFLLDIDGTVSFDATPFDGTLDFCEAVSKNGGKYIFITNNSTKSNKDYVDKFLKMGIPVDNTSFLTATSATILYLKEKYAGKLIYVCGTKSFIAELVANDIRVTEKEEEGIDAVLVAYDSELTYDKLVLTCKLLSERNLPFLATNPDLVCPVGFGYVPDCGSICGMIVNAVKREPVYIGKPNSVMADVAMATFGYSKEETVVIGDRLYTDIACGINAGVDTIVVFTGEAKFEDLENTEFPPTYYCENIRDIYNAIK